MYKIRNHLIQLVDENVTVIIGDFFVYVFLSGLFEFLKFFNIIDLLLQILNLLHDKLYLIKLIHYLLEVLGTICKDVSHKLLILRVNDLHLIVVVEEDKV